MRSILAAALVGATLTLAAFAVPATAQEAVRTLTVTGRGELSFDPDVATIRIAVQTEAETAVDALDQASAAISAILATLDAEGILLEQIETRAIQLSPRYSSSVLSSGNTIIGFQGINSISIEITDFARIGPILAKVVGDGANRLDRVSFGLLDPDEALDAARRAAVFDGARLAQLYADAAGVPLGQLILLDETDRRGFAPVVVMEESASAMFGIGASVPQCDVPVAISQINLTASVTMKFEIAAD